MFDASSDGGLPSGGLIQASDGALYGTTRLAGPAGGGTVYRLTLAGDQTLVHSFGARNSNAVPLGGVIQASDGALYGGTSAHCGEQFCDTRPGVFRLTLDGAFTDLFTIGPPTFQSIVGGLVEGPNARFYGVVSRGGIDGESGYIFRFMPPTRVWTFNTSPCGSGCALAGPVIYGLDGALYGPGNSYVFRVEDLQP